MSIFGPVGWKTLVDASALFSILLGHGTAVMAANWLRDELPFGQAALKDEGRTPEGDGVSDSHQR